MPVPFAGMKMADDVTDLFIDATRGHTMDQSWTWMICEEL